MKRCRCRSSPPTRFTFFTAPAPFKMGLPAWSLSNSLSETMRIIPLA